MVVNQAFDRAVVEVAVTHAEAAAGGQALRVNFELVVLRRHGDPAGSQVEHRVVAAMVTKRKSAREGPGCLADQLMTETDTEHR